MYTHYLGSFNLINAEYVKDISKTFQTAFQVISHFNTILSIGIISPG